MEMYGYEFISATELKHHGILGQKWGKRNGPPYPLDASDHSAREKKAGWRKSLTKPSNDKNLRAKTLREDHERSMQNYEKDLPKEKKSRMTAEQRKKYAEMLVGAAAVMGIGAAIYFSYKNQSITEMAKLATEGTLTKETAKGVMLETLDNGDQILKQGDVIHRMSAYADVDFSQATKPLYVSFEDQDVASYMILLKDWSGTGERYDVVLQAMKDLRIPSEQKARAMFDELWNNDPTYRQKLQKTVTDAYIKLGQSPEAASFSARRDISRDPFKMGMYSIVKNKEDTAIWIDKLKSNGYDAIIDYFDKSVMADSPLILFDPAGSIQKVGETKVTKQMKIKTLKALKAKGITRMPGTGYTVDFLLRYI